MLLQYWIAKYSRLDSNFKRGMCDAFIDEVKKYQKNVDYYFTTSNPVLFLSIIYHKSELLAIDALISSILKLKMVGILDEIKSCVLAVAKKDILSITLKEHRAVMENCRVNCTGKNQILASLLSNLITLRINKSTNLMIVQSIVKMLVALIDKQDAELQIMNNLRKIIGIEVFESLLVE